MKQIIERVKIQNSDIARLTHEIIYAINNHTDANAICVNRRTIEAIKAAWSGELRERFAGYGYPLIYGVAVVIDNNMEDNCVEVGSYEEINARIKARSFLRDYEKIAFRINHTDQQ